MGKHRRRPAAASCCGAHVCGGIKHERLNGGRGSWRNWLLGSTTTTQRCLSGIDLRSAPPPLDVRTSPVAQSPLPRSWWRHSGRARENVPGRDRSAAQMGPFRANGICEFKEAAHQSTYSMDPSWEKLFSTTGFGYNVGREPSCEEGLTSVNWHNMTNKACKALNSP